MNRTLTLPTAMSAIAATLLIAAPSVHADMYDYLREVDHYGLAYPSTGDAIAAGQAACDDLRSGATVLQTLTNTANRGYDAAHADMTVVLAATRNMWVASHRRCK